MRGSLDIPKESWEGDKKSSESIIRHVLQMREELAQMSELVAENQGTAESTQKYWYDQIADPESSRQQTRC